MFLRIATVTTATAAALVLGAGVSEAAPAAAAPAPPLAGTSQTITITEAGGFTNTTTIDFADSTWQLEGYPDSGSWVVTGAKVGLTTNSKADHGCGYSGTYKAKSHLYVGKFACQTDGPSGTFTLTATAAAAT